MALISFVLPFAEIAFLTAPTSGTSGSGTTDRMAIIVAMVLLVLFGLGVLRAALREGSQSRQHRQSSRRHQRPPRKGRGGRTSRAERPVSFRNPILVDGSNVMHWKDEVPQIMPVQAVVRELKRRGFTPGVVFDANAGYKLHDRYMNEGDFAVLLDLPESQVFVVPKGTQADPYLLDAASRFGARVVTLDRFRDWAKAHPEVTEPGFLIRGGYRNTGEFWLAEAAPLPKAATV